MLQKTVEPPPLAVDVRTLGRMLGLHPDTIRNQVKAGMLPAPKYFGRSARWVVAEIERHLANMGGGQ